MTVSTTSLSVETFVERLVGTEDAGRRRALIERQQLPPDQRAQAVRQLLDEAVKLFGANPPRMERLCNDAALLVAHTGDEYLQAMVVMRRADAARALGQNTGACGLYDEAAAAFTRINRPVEAARTRIGWIESAGRLGLLTRALTAARSARRTLRNHGETTLVAMAELSTANACSENGQYSRAVRGYATALRHFLSLGEAGRLNAARCYASMSVALGQLGRHRDALEKLELSREIYEHAGELAGAGRVTRTIGVSHLSMGRYSAALSAFEAARSAFHGLRLTGLVAAVVNDTAECYLRLNRPHDALAVLTEVESEPVEAEYAPAAFGAATRRVAAYLLLDEPAEALRVIDEADDRFPSGMTQHRAWLAVQRAMAHLRNGDPKQARAAARHAAATALEGGMRGLVAEALVVEGQAVLALGETSDAERAALRARRISRGIDAAPLLSRTYALLGEIAEATGRPAQAMGRYAAAIEQLEREQRGVIFEFRDTFAADRGVAFERLARLQLLAARPADALLTAECGKSRALADAIAGNVQLRPRGGAATRRIARQLATAREDYAAARARLAMSDAETETPELYAAVRGRLVAGGMEGEHSRLAELEDRIARLVQQLQLAGDASELVDLYHAAPGARLPELPPGTCLLEFFFSGDDILRFQVDSRGVQATILRNALPEVERLLRVFRLNLDACERAEPASLAALGRQALAVLARLHARLLADLCGIEQYRSLVVVPHGILHYLPFHALHDGERYLVERVPVSYAPSAALFDICQSRRVRGGKALVLGHSLSGRLPFALTEANQVASVLACSPWIEAAASRALLEAEGRRAALIHVAAHGEFRPDAPLFSCIELAGGPLTTADVFNLDLRAALVTLSACETGRSVLGGGDELEGLIRAFLYAGAASLLVSQWRVDDASTAELMAHFYGALMHGAGRASALRAAQLAGIAAADQESGRFHPFFWAGFQIIGDDRPITTRRRRARREEVLTG